MAKLKLQTDPRVTYTFGFSQTSINQAIYNQPIFFNSFYKLLINISIIRVHCIDYKYKNHTCEVEASPSHEGAWNSINLKLTCNF